MDANELKQLKSSLQRARKQPMNFALALGKQTVDHRLSLHPLQAGRNQAKALKDVTGLALITWGMTEVDADRPDTLVLVLEGRILSGMCKKLQAWLKLMGAPVKRVAIKVDGLEVQDADEAGDEAVQPPSQTLVAAADQAPAWQQIGAAIEQIKPLLTKALQHPGMGEPVAKLLDVLKNAREQQALPQAQKALKLIIQQVQQLKQLPAADQAPVTPSRAPLPTVQGLPEGLNDAILKTFSAASDPKLKADREKLKQQGSEVQSLVLQMRAATLKNDQASVKALQILVDEKREETRKQLQSLIPKKGIPKDQGKEAWVALVSRLDLSSPRDGAVFWSGDKGNAIDLATDRHGISLESTSGGCLMDDWRMEGVPWSEKEGEGPPFMKDLWQLMSATYAMQAEGEIATVQTSKKYAEGGGEMWQTVEKRILLAKAKRGQVRFAPTIVRDPLPQVSETGKP